MIKWRNREGLKPRLCIHRMYTCIYCTCTYIHVYMYMYMYCTCIANNASSMILNGR